MGRSWQASNNPEAWQAMPYNRRMDAENAPPQNLVATVERYFVEHRAKLLDVAAFLDRCDRAAGGGGGEPGADADFRIEALRRAVALLDDGNPDRTRRILELMSDLSDTPLDAASPGAASGAPRPTGT